MESVYQSRQKFGQYMRQLRKARQLTIRAVRGRCGVKESTISAIECGDKVAGAVVAARIADGLGLEGKDRESFLVGAAATQRKNRLAGFARMLPSEVVNYLPRALRSMGIGDESIQGCRLVEKNALEGVEPAIATKLSGSRRSKPQVDGDVLLVDTDNGPIAFALVIATAE